MTFTTAATQTSSGQTLSNLLGAAKAAASGTGSGTTAATASTGANSATAAGSASPTAATAALSGNETQFLKLLLTQLQNQDPSSPVDVTQFTSELVQYASVEQQINTNSNLTQLIQLTQSNTLIQASGIVGKQVSVQSDHLSLQHGKAGVQFTTTSAEPVAIAVYDDSGVQLANATLTSQPGSNSWTWNGLDGSGNQVPDGAYRVAVIGANADGSTQAIPFTVVGTATGVNATGTAVQLQLGDMTVDFSKVSSVAN